jgi:hypothetical protein
MQNDGPESLQSLYVLHRPDWAAWKPVESMKLWHAVALACDLNPNQFTVFNQSKLNRMFGIKPPVQFEDLLSLAKNNLGAGTLKLLKFSVDGFEESEISPSVFGAWVTDLKWPLPVEFPWQAEVLRPLGRDWPWGRHETKLLVHLAEAASKFWRNYDPTDATTAPTNEAVSKWLKSRGVSARTADIMASILRADGLATGPRK